MVILLFKTNFIFFSGQYELNPHPDHEFGTLQASLSQRENVLLKNLVNLETESREHIAMNLKTREGIMDGIKNAANIKYDVLKEGYNTAVKRIAYFMRKIEFFQNFLLEDKRALIGNDVHILRAQSFTSMKADLYPDIKDVDFEFSRCPFMMSPIF